MSQNAKCEVKGNVLTITVDLKEDFGPSGSGKNITVAKCRETLPNGFTAQLNVWKPMPKAAK